MAEFEKDKEDLAKLGVGLVALSVDAEKYAQKSVDKNGITFPVIYGLDGPAESSKIGGFVDEEKGFFHATNFILRNGKVKHATYSTGPLGRLRAKNVAMLVNYYQGLEKSD